MAIRGVKPTTPQTYVQTGDSLDGFDPPEDLSDEAKAVWATLLPDLIELKVYKESDGVLLAELCSSLAMARDFRRSATALQAQELAALKGKNYEAAETASEMVKRSRAGYQGMMRLALSLSAEFGVSPVSRLRLGLCKLTGSSLVEMLTSGDQPSR